MTHAPRKTRPRGARVRRLLSATVGVLILGSVVLLTASVVAFATVGPAFGLAFAGLAITAAGLAFQDSRVALRTERLADDQLLARLALQTIAVDGAAMARTVGRLTGVTERGVRAALVHRLRMSPSAAGADVDPSLLAAILALSPRHVLFLGEPADAEAHRAALASLAPTSQLHVVPAEVTTAGTVIERLAVRLRRDKLPTPLVVARGRTHVREAVWGVTAPLILELFRTTDFLVAVPPGAHSVVDESPPTPSVRAMAVANTLVLVSAHPPTSEQRSRRGQAKAAKP